MSQRQLTAISGEQETSSGPACARFRLPDCIRIRKPLGTVNEYLFLYTPEEAGHDVGSISVQITFSSRQTRPEEREPDAVLA